MKTTILLSIVLLLCVRHAHATLTCTESEQAQGAWTCVESIDYAGQYVWSVADEDGEIVAQEPPHYASFVCRYKTAAPIASADGSELVQPRLPVTITVAMPFWPAEGFGAVHMTTVYCDTVAPPVVSDEPIQFALYWPSHNWSCYVTGGWSGWRCDWGYWRYDWWWLEEQRIEQ